MIGITKDKKLMRLKKVALKSKILRMRMTGRVLSLTKNLQRQMIFQRWTVINQTMDLGKMLIHRILTLL